jgi:hypothetical protein
MQLGNVLTCQRTERCSRAAITKRSDDIIGSPITKHCRHLVLADEVTVEVQKPATKRTV